MYKSHHKFIQRAADAAVSANSMPYDPKLTPEQNRENLVSRKKKLMERLLSLPKGKERKALSMEVGILNRAISDIRPKKKAPPGVMDFYVSATKELAGVAMAKLIMDRAVKMAEDARDALSENGEANG